ncbi:MAG: AgmX/PglI C-terminal domain-containing protein [Deltaproteobacteria bacterium]|nr:AgmX/PglI C-terminal domain-containing protein [Deltaproteobacteria bacterium]
MKTRLGIVLLGLLAGCGGAHNAASSAAAPPTPVAAATPATAVTEPLPADPAGPGDAAAAADPAAATPPDATAAPDAPADGVGVGQPGTIAYGSRTVAGPGGSAKPSSPPVAAVVPGAPEVRGSLDKELLRRIVRRHLTELKFCYEKELTRNPGLRGRVTLQFTIAPTGAVAASLVQSTTLGNPLIEQCFAAAVRRWEFPKPAGGVVIVTYPFVLENGAR